MKKTSGDIIILHMCTKNYDHMMCSFWDMVHGGQTEGWTDGHTHGETGGPTDRRMEKWHVEVGGPPEK